MRTSSHSLFKTNLLCRFPVITLEGSKEPLQLDSLVLWLCPGCLFPQLTPGLSVIIQRFEGQKQLFKSKAISDRRLRIAQLECLLNAPLLVGIVRVEEEDVCFPCLP